MVGLAFTARDFYPRPPRGGRHHPAIISREQKEISIHALREEGDPVRNELYHHHQHFYPRPPRGGRLTSLTPENWNVLFLSTPSARRATGRCCSPSHSAGISIHALREEGDSPNQVATILKINFYPRPPRGGRLQLAEPASPGVEISIHALREEGDSNPPVWVELISGFLSTPSARRAT